ncbi:MAG: bifunctional metallophosphatase/5'-nucleotidase [Faecousia sp.]
MKIYFTSDLHGYFSPLDYATGNHADTGAANCMARFRNDGNTLIIDGGDTLQGSPLTYYLRKTGLDAAEICARVMNCAGYDFFTLGNHDFNFGPDQLQRYINAMEGYCLCANVSGLKGVRDTAVVTMKNGLRVGLTGIVTHHITIWERPENLKGLTISDPLPAAKRALEKLREQGAELTVCIYHGGFECDLDTGALLSDTDENQGYRICQELDFDILLTGHQHLPIAPRRVGRSFVCQTPDKGRKFALMQVGFQNGAVTAQGTLEAPGSLTDPEAAAILSPLDEGAGKWLDTPVGHLDRPLLPQAPIVMAEQGSDIANFFNQVQLFASGADISCTSLGNEVKGFRQDVTVRDVVATYIYPNTLQTLEVDRAVLKQALERCASYFSRREDGTLEVSQEFLRPKTEHYNYDYFSGIEVTMDVREPVGERVKSIRYQGRELPASQQLKLCMNNYRASGTGGYGCYLTCPKVKSQSTEISELIMDYVLEHRDIRVDQTKWLTVLH